MINIKKKNYLVQNKNQKNTPEYIFRRQVLRGIGCMVVVMLKSSLPPTILRMAVLIWFTYNGKLCRPL